MTVDAIPGGNVEICVTRPFAKQIGDGLFKDGWAESANTINRTLRFETPAYDSVSEWATTFGTIED